MVAGLDLEYNAKCRCDYCKTNKVISQKINRYIFDIKTSYKIGSKKQWN